VIVAVGGMAGAPTDASGDGSNGAAGAPAPDFVIPTLTLKAVRSTYHLRDASNLKRRLEDARRSEADEQGAHAAGRNPDPKAHVEYPEPPAIDLLLTIRNASRKFVRRWDRGDGVTLTISLQGAGAVTASLQQERPAVLIVPRPVVLAPGETRAIRLHRLLSGFRGDTVHAYWTEPGQYQVSVEWRTAVAPARNTKPPERPPYASDDGEVWRPITVTSNAVTIRVKSP
jgi:hypothetical protein